MGKKGTLTLLEPHNRNNIIEEVDNIYVENRKYKQLSFTLDEWRIIEEKAVECRMRTATYIKYMALHGKIVNVDMESANSILGALSRIGSNVNQIAHRANITEYITHDDLQNLMKWRDELRRTSRAYLSTIQSALACDT